MRRRTEKYNTLLFLCIAAIGLGFAWNHPAAHALQTLAAAGFFLISGRLVAHSAHFYKIEGKYAFGITFVGLAYIVLHSLLYFFYKSTPASIFITFAIVGIGVYAYSFFFGKKIPSWRGAIVKIKDRWARQKYRKPELILFGLILSSQAILLWKIFSKATTGTLASPWLIIGYKFFLLYGVLTVLLLLFQFRTKKHVLGMLSLRIHLFLTFSIAAAVYILGFGYDPFLHRASEQLIFEQGFVLPKTPFYVGQYAIVNTLAHITGLAIKTIDIWLVPIVATTLLPLVGWHGFKHGLSLDTRTARVATLLLLLFPLQTFIATTPYNLANVFLLATILIGLSYHTSKGARILTWAFALTSAATHVLSGLFALWFVLFLTFFRYRKKIPKLLFKSGNIFFFLFASISIPTLFIVYQAVFQGLPVPPLSYIPLRAKEFLVFFKEPYYFSQENVAFIWDVIYSYRKLIIPLLLAFFIYGMRNIKRKLRHAFLFLFVITCINAFLTHTWLVFPELNQYDASQYAGRLLHISMFFVLPVAAFGCVLMIKKLTKKRAALFGVSVIALATCLTMSLYLTYPQTNEKVYFRGFNVTTADMEVTTYIHDHTPPGTRYVVLSNIITAAAAIEQYGFETYYKTPYGSQFYYAIPSGSPLYLLYLEMIHEGQRRETMEKAHILTNTDVAYFVIPHYWDHFDKIVANAKNTADAAIEIDGGNMWLFAYYANAD